MERVKRLSVHLTSGSRDVRADQAEEGNARRAAYASHFVEELPAPGEYDISQHLLGPLRDKEKFPGGWKEVRAELEKEEKLGRSHVKFAEWQLEYGNSMATNIVVPSVVVKRENGDEGRLAPPFIRYEVIIGDPEDARRIARVHIRKQPNFNVAFYSSIISTLDDEYWRKQREQLLPAFLPQSSLQHIFHVSADRAQFCADRLRKEAAKNGSIVDMNDFLLYETQAQLQLALFGETNEFMERTNEPFRRAMSGEENPRNVRPFLEELASHMDYPDRVGPVLPENAAAGKCPMTHGPLGAQLRDFEDKRGNNRVGNALIFAFAGHDTTGHTLSWLLYELSQNPQVLERLQQEVDAFHVALNGRKPVYEDLQLLPFMTRCIMETLRLWPAVTNGTFREILFDDYITGPNGEDVKLPKGTYVRIVNWSRHRNPELWGPDADKFNPDRDFQGDEIWNGNALRAYNPATGRFSPFTFPPRGCIGMNFAHLEMRLIMANLLKDFTFELSPEFKSKHNPATYVGVNYGTMGPQDLTKPELVKGYPGYARGEKVPLGLPMRVVPRKK